MDNNETESQTSVLSRKSEIIDILKNFESSSGMTLFCYFYIGIALIFFTIACFVTIHFLTTDIKWIHSTNANIVQLFQIH